jgi:hypothetical protein
MLSDACSDFIGNIFALIETDLQTGIETYADSDIEGYPPLIERLHTACDAALESQETNDIEPLIALIREAHAVQTELDRPASPAGCPRRQPPPS